MGDLLLLGVVIALEPLPIIGFILVLSTPRGPRNGLGFIGGWVVCLAAIIVAAAALDGGKPLKSGSAPSTAAAAVTIALGVGLGAYAAWKHLHPRTGPPKQPGWAKKLDQIGPGGAAVIGVLLQPWALVAAGGVRVLRAGALGRRLGPGRRALRPRGDLGAGRHGDLRPGRPRAGRGTARCSPRPGSIATATGRS